MRSISSGLFTSGFLLMSLLAACSSDSNGAASDGGTTGDGADTDGGGFCCPADSTPGCCMKYGGWSVDGNCRSVCDGMPNPGDPGWKLTTDSHGCSGWSNAKPDFGPGTCGYPTNLDSGFDSGSDANVDDSGRDAADD